jgi:hypothetical protein
MRITATEAKNAPVLVEKDGRIETVLLPLKQFGAPGDIENDQSISVRRKQFEGRYGA